MILVDLLYLVTYISKLHPLHTIFVSNLSNFVAITSLMICKFFLNKNVIAVKFNPGLSKAKHVDK